MRKPLGHEEQVHPEEDRLRRIHPALIDRDRVRVREEHRHVVLHDGHDCEHAQAVQRRISVVEQFDVEQAPGRTHRARVYVAP